MCNKIRELVYYCFKCSVEDKLTEEGLTNYRTTVVTQAL